MKRILIIDDEAAVCLSLSRFLERHHYEATSVATGQQALSLLREQEFHLIFCSYQKGNVAGKSLLGQIKILAPNCIVIFVGGHISACATMELMEDGAYHYLTKPLYPEEILSLVEKVFSEQKTLIYGAAKEQLPKKPNVHAPGYIKGKSSQAALLHAHINLVAPTDYSVIIQGETGTGKESTAHLIHENSGRSKAPFVAIDCGSLSKDLAASELFGHERGAFTGALQTKVGAFELANGGTAFLDEIGNLSYEVQMLLLRAIQEKTIRRVGGVKEKPVDIRLIVASNENLYEAVQKREFRQDLFHRLNEFTLYIPPLRERMEDLDLFVNEFIKQTSQALGKNIPVLTDSVQSLFAAYRWPGNIRELKNAIKRACLLTTDGNILPEALPTEILESCWAQSFGPKKLLTETDGSEEYSLKDAAQKAERGAILEAMKQVRYNKTKAANLLNIDRKTLYNKLRLMQAGL